MGGLGRGEGGAGERRAADADRDVAIRVLDQALARDLLSPEEHEERVASARDAATVAELVEIIDDLWVPRSLAPRPPGERRRRAVAVAVAATLLILTLLIGTLSAITPKPGLAPSPQQVRVPGASVTPSTDTPITATVAPPGAFASHDPADECGYWPTGASTGESNCYLVVQFTNTTGAPVTFSPRDLQIAGSGEGGSPTGDTSPPCWDPVDTGQQQTLAPGAQLTVQLCYPVAPGDMPVQLVGAGSLAGLRSPQIPKGAVRQHWPNGS